jgi:hypothetical protein
MKGIAMWIFKMAQQSAGGMSNSILLSGTKAKGNVTVSVLSLSLRNRSFSSAFLRTYGTGVSVCCRCTHLL